MQFCKPRNANQVNTRIPNDFLNRFNKKVLARNFRLRKYRSSRFRFLIENIPLCFSISGMNAYRGIFVENRLIDFIVGPIEIFAVDVNALTTVKRVRQIVLSLNRVTRHSKVSMIQRRYITFRTFDTYSYF